MEQSIIKTLGFPTSFSAAFFCSRMPASSSLISLRFSLRLAIWWARCWIPPWASSSWNSNWRRRSSFSTNYQKKIVHSSTSAVTFYQPSLMMSKSKHKHYIFYYCSMLTYGILCCWRTGLTSRDNEYCWWSLFSEAKTKWPSFLRQHFEMDFLEWKCMDMD